MERIQHIRKKSERRQVEIRMESKERVEIKGRVESKRKRKAGF